MNSWLSSINGSFASPWIFWAGLGLVAAPVIIHLLHRRRFRVVEWAAMEFLRAAVKRNRRILQLRDLLLLALRMLAMLLLGLALAQMSCSGDGRSSGVIDGSRPLHAVLLVDNSMSMGYQSLEGSLLDAARVKAKAYIDRLPRGSRVTVIPLCGARRGYSPDPYYSPEDAIEALAAIEPVDRTANMQRAINDARQACEAAPELAKRIVLFGDQQMANWSGFAAASVPAGSSEGAELPPVQLVNLAPDDWENTSISSLGIPDGLADVDTPTTIVVELRHQSSRPPGAESRKEVQVTLEVDGISAGAKVVTLEPGSGSREVAFEHLFSDVRPEPGQSVSVPLRAYISPDRLPADDARHYVAQVVAALPVTFIDQVGPKEENVAAGRIGETRPLRRLLAPLLGKAPREAAEPSTRPLVRARHLTIEEVTRETLADARLVVIAGVADPGPATELLAEYVAQGGRLFIAAGGDFDPVIWQSVAWSDGRGFLPAPLLSEPLGALPEESTARGKPGYFNIAFESLGAHPYFQLADASEQELRDLVAEPFFFKAVRVGPLRENDRKATVLANLNDEAHTPLLVEAKIRKGRVVFFASGLTLGWNTLADTNAMAFCDRILRSLLESTLPERNFPAQDRIALSLPLENRSTAVAMRRPRTTAGWETLDTGFIGASEWGVTVSSPLVGGFYRLATVEDDADEDDEPKWSACVSVNGPAAESDLTPMSRAMLEERIAVGGAGGGADNGAPFEWVEAGEEISLAGRQSRAEYAWWYLAAALLLVLLVETTLAAWPKWRAA